MINWRAISLAELQKPANRLAVADTPLRRQPGTEPGWELHGLYNWAEARCQATGGQGNPSGCCEAKPWGVLSSGEFSLDKQ